MDPVNRRVPPGPKFCTSPEISPVWRVNETPPEEDDPVLKEAEAPKGEKLAPLKEEGLSEPVWV